MYRSQLLYLDVLRAFSALVVFVYHWSFSTFSGGLFRTPDEMGHSAVVVFFVISGYIISYSTLKRSGTLTGFLARRAARIYSVAIPALVVTALVDFMVYRSTGHLEHLYQYKNFWIYLPLFLAFLSDIWFLNENTFSNIPFWSLSYEVWYYIIFAVLVFAASWPRILLVAGIFALLGPRHLLLFPIWLFGWAIHYFNHRFDAASGRAPPYLFLTSAVLVVAMVWDKAGPRLRDHLGTIFGIEAVRSLRYSQYFLTDTLLGILVAVNIWAFGRWGSIRLPFEGAIRFLAGTSFSIYLLHFPMLLLFRTVLGFGGLWTGILALATCIAIGRVVEPQKVRLLQAITWVLGRRGAAQQA